MTTKQTTTTIVQDGDPVLRAVAAPVALADISSKEIRDVLARMNKALDKEHDGVAIAAPQIGVSLRIFIVSRKAFAIDDEERTGEKPSVLNMPERNMIVINPEIIKLSKRKVTVPEGCLSVRWMYGNTHRHEKALIRGYDEHGKAFTYGGSGLLAQIFQHEIDHLNGILFSDHATDLEPLSNKEIAEMERRANEEEKGKK